MAKSTYPQVIPMADLRASGNNSLPSHGQYDTYGVPPALPRNSLIGMPDIADAKKSSMSHNGVEHQLMSVEIEKEAELGLVIGKVEGDPWIFIDEILPNGMIEMHGTLKEGDYLLQAGLYSLIGVDVPTALLLIEKAYDDGRKTVSFAAARADAKKAGKRGDASLPKPSAPKSYDQPPVTEPITAVEIPEKRPLPSSQAPRDQPASPRRARSNPRRVVKTAENDENDTTQF